MRETKVKPNYGTSNVFSIVIIVFIVSNRSERYLVIYIFPDVQWRRLVRLWTFPIKNISTQNKWSFALESSLTWLPSFCTVRFVVLAFWSWMFYFSSNCGSFVLFLLSIRAAILFKCLIHCRTRNDRASCSFLFLCRRVCFVLFAFTSVFYLERRSVKIKQNISNQMMIIRIFLCWFEIHKISESEDFSNPFKIWSDVAFSSTIVSRSTNASIMTACFWRYVGLSSEHNSIVIFLGRVFFNLNVSFDCRAEMSSNRILYFTRTGQNTNEVVNLRWDAFLIKDISLALFGCSISEGITALWRC